MSQKPLEMTDLKVLEWIFESKWKVYFSPFFLIPNKPNQKALTKLIKEIFVSIATDAQEELGQKVLGSRFSRLGVKEKRRESAVIADFLKEKFSKE